MTPEQKTIIRKFKRLRREQFNPVLESARELANEVCPTTSKNFPTATTRVLLTSLHLSLIPNPNAETFVESMLIAMRIGEAMPDGQLDAIGHYFGKDAEFETAINLLKRMKDRK